MAAEMKVILWVLLAVTLTACGGGGGGSTPLPPAAPVANAGAGQNVQVGSTVTLDGSASSAANGASLTFLWTMASKPAGSSAAIVNPTTVNPSLLVDAAGIYVIGLTVNDGKLTSTPASVTILVTGAKSAQFGESKFGEATFSR
jgi:hypothetical protein